VYSSRHLAFHRLSLGDIDAEIPNKSSDNTVKRGGLQNKGLKRLTRCQRDRRDHVGLGMPAMVEDIVSYTLHTPIYTQYVAGTEFREGLTLEIIDSMVEKWAAHDLQP
jgi:hypothetical protein